MLRYILWRIAVMVPTLLIISALVFAIIELPPGDYFESYIAEIRAQGEGVNMEQIEALRKQYGFDQPPILRYVYWVAGMLQGDFGYSFEYELPVSEVVGERLWLTVLVSFVTIIFTWSSRFRSASMPPRPVQLGRLRPVADRTHRHRNSEFHAGPGPHVFRQYLVRNLDRPFDGPEVSFRADELGKAKSILEHIWIPVIIVGAAGTAGMIRRLRANLLDELQKQYVVTARAKGLSPTRTLLKYPLRMALNFFISDIGSILPAIISGAEITAIVLSLETTGPMLIKALQSQDMYLAGSFLMFLAFLTVIGVLVSDLALAVLDPRIRLQGRSTK